MKSFLLKCLVVLAGIVAIDLSVGAFGKFLIKELNKKNYSGQAALLGYNLEGAQADILVVGSSTASCHFIPSVLKDSINVLLDTTYDAFNAGAYYQQPPYSYCVLKSIIERKVPSIVILDIQPQSLGEAVNSAGLKPLRPYYSINKNVKEILDDNEAFYNRICLKSGLFRFNTEIIKLIASFRNPIGDDGFFPKEGELDHYDMVYESDTNDLNPVFVSEFKRTLEIANDNGIQLFVVLSPRLSYPDKDSKSYKKIYELCKKHNIEILDYTSDDDLLNCRLFCDKFHLNPTGASMLTLKLFEDIKYSLKKNK